MLYGGSSYGSASYGGNLGAQSLTPTLTDTVNVSSSLVKFTSRTISNIVNVAIQTFTAAPIFVETFTDLFYVRTTGLIKDISKLLNSTLIVNSTITDIINYVRTLTDSLNVASVITTVYIHVRTMVDSLYVRTIKLVRRLNGVLMLWTKIRKSVTTAYTKLAKEDSDWTKISKPQL